MIWLEDAENDLGELEMKRWKQKAINGKEQASVIKEAKVRTQHTAKE